MTYTSLVLASRSPRRSQLLAQIGVRHEVCAADLDEAQLPGEAPRDYVTRIARDKALYVAKCHEGLAKRALLAADTAVVLGDRILGKPQDEASCLRMLDTLGGRVHQVMTAVALLADGSLRSDVSISSVSLRKLSVDEARSYWATGEPADKAGGYAVQGLGAIFVERIEGSYSGVMGLPLFETARLLSTAGVRCWQEHDAG